MTVLNKFPSHIQLALLISAMVNAVYQRGLLWWPQSDTNTNLIELLPHPECRVSHIMQEFISVTSTTTVAASYSCHCAHIGSTQVVITEGLITGKRTAITADMGMVRASGGLEAVHNRKIFVRTGNRTQLTWTQRVSWVYQFNYQSKHNSNLLHNMYNVFHKLHVSAHFRPSSGCSFCLSSVVA